MDRLQSMGKAELHEETKRCASRNKMGGGAVSALKGSKSMSIAQSLEMLRRNAQEILSRRSGGGAVPLGGLVGDDGVYDNGDGDGEGDDDELEIGASSQEEDSCYDDEGTADAAPLCADRVTLALAESFGFAAYRQGQRWAIDRCLAGKSSLLVMPTGAGKSLCYMLPAVLLPGLTIVVSPLIALMQDQMKKLPVHLPGAVMGGKISTYDMTKVSSGVLEGVVKVLFVSPERLCSQPFRSLMRALHASLGEAAVSLLCVDEAHCLSQWSYNFRPAFLRIRRELQHIRPASVLALTATAPPKMQREIMV